jgi:hypothetical protein
MSGRVNLSEATAGLKFVSRPVCREKQPLQVKGSRYIFYFPLPFQIKNTQADIYLNYKNPKIPFVVFQY